VSKVQFLQRNGGDCWAASCWRSAVRIVSRRRLLRVFHGPGILSSVPLVSSIRRFTALAWSRSHIPGRDLLTVGAVQLLGELSAQVYPTHPAARGESFASEISVARIDRDLGPRF